MRAWLKAIVLLPFNVLVVIPAIVLYFTGYVYSPPAIWAGVSGILLLAAGLSLAVWTMFLFAFVGKGTAAPWDPPKNLVVKGPYRHVRNPMITSVLTILLAETLLLTSVETGALFVLFFLVNSIYFPLFEEKDLEKRFGEPYLLYKKNVPRWVPKLNGWDLPC